MLRGRLARRLPVLLFLAAVASSAAGLLAADFEVSISIKAGKSQRLEEPFKAQVSLAPATKIPDGHPEARLLEIQVPGVAGISLPAGTRWRLSADAEDWWIEDRDFAVSEELAPIELRAFRAGVFSGSVRVPAKDELPGQLRVRFEPSPEKDQHLPKAVELCPVNDRRRFWCKVPAGVLDLKLQAEGFVPHYRWGVDVPPGAGLQLGSLQLRPGSSVVGWIEAPDKSFDFAACTIELAPAVAPFMTPEEVYRRAAVTAQARVNSRGFFQLAAVAEGSYTLSALHPDFAPTRVTPVTVAERAEVELAALELQRPATFNLQVVRLETDPFMKRWGIRLSRSTPQPGLSSLVAEGLASETGAFQTTGLEPGSYSLTVVDSRDSTWAHEEVEIFAGETFHEVKVVLRRLEGSVTIGGEPVPAAEVVFQENYGGRRLSMLGEEDGHFYIFLPHGVTWDVSVSQEELEIQASFDKVEIPDWRPEEGEPWAKIELEIPDTLIEGNVVADDGGSLAASVLVDAYGSDGEDVSQQTAEDGSFKIRGMKPGTVRLQARDSSASDKDRRSQVEKLSLREEEVAGPVMLVMLENPRIEGLVISPAGHGVPGAQIVANLDLEPGTELTTTVPSTYSDIDGVFDLALPPRTRAAWLTILPPGFAVSQLRVELPVEDPIIVSVGMAGGTVIITYPEPPAAFEEVHEGAAYVLGMRTLLVGEAVIANPISLGEWRRLHKIIEPEGQFIVPMLEPGPYSACYGTGPASFLYRGAALPPELERYCSAGYLAPYGELELKIPRAAVEAEVKVLEAQSSR